MTYQNATKKALQLETESEQEHLDKRDGMKLAILAVAARIEALTILLSEKLR